MLPKKVAPGCSRSAASVCEREKNACERRNNSIHEEFCQCYMNFQACLININPKSCMRGSFCVLNRHNVSTSIVRLNRNGANLVMQRQSMIWKFLKRTHFWKLLCIMHPIQYHC